MKWLFILTPPSTTLADGLAAGLDANRLRLAGKDVVPLSVAYAFVSLWAALEYGDGAVAGESMKGYWQR